MIESRRREYGRFTGWNARVQPARSIATPAVWGGSVVFGGGFGSHEVYAVDARTGRLAWELRTEDDGPTAATVIDGVAFLNTESCTLEAIDVARGTLLWEKWLGDPLLAQPAAAGGRVLMVWPSRGNHHLGAFDVRTGEPLWETEVAADIISAPVIAGDRAYVTTFDGSVTCVDAANGARLWTRPMQATSAPWVVGDDVYVAHRDHGDRAGARRPHRAGRPAPPEREPVEEEPLERIARLKTQGGIEAGAFAFKEAAYLAARHGAARKAAFHVEDAAVGFGHAPPSAKMFYAKNLIGEAHVSRAWRFQGSRPVVAGGVLYETAGDRLEATEIATGRVLWTWGDARAMEGERRLTPPAVANGRVLLGTWDGRLVSLDAGSGAVRWDVSVGAPVHWQPVMAGGRVFAGLEDGSVACVETGDPGDDGWAMWGGGPGHNGPAGPSGTSTVAGNGGRRNPADAR